MRDQVVQEIRRLAKQNGGQAPGQTLFARETGITESSWRGKYWARWGDALVDAGFAPNDWNERLNSDDVLSRVIDACRHYKRLPTKSEFQLYRRIDRALPSYASIARHFDGQSGIIAALAKRAADDSALADIAAMLPATKAASPALSTRSNRPIEGFVYLIKSGDFYKIGRSGDAERRFKQISVALPDKAELFHTIRTDDPPGIEAYWHRRFADRRANGEWFKLSSLEVSAFKRRKFQ
jgi:hypothetical protein